MYTNDTNINRRGFLSIPLAILIAGLIIAVAVIYATGKNAAAPTGGSRAAATVAEAIAPRIIDEDDHIRGTIGAPIKIIEYSDTECPFCKSFHPVMKEVLAAYGGRVAWVYRHFPITQLHTKAPKEAEATECAAELGGPPGSEARKDAFWKYLDRLFEVTPSNNRLDPAELPRIAEYIGVNRGQFEACLESGEFAARVSRDYEDGINAGVDATPYSFVVTQSGARYPFSGAQPFEAVKRIVDAALALE